MFFYWLIFLGICDVANGQVVSPLTPNGGTQYSTNVTNMPETEIRKCLVKVALSQTHVRERTGRNDGVEVRKYLKILHLPEGTPYCGAFIEWIYRQCGISSNVQAPAVAYSWIKYPQRIVWNKGPIRDKKAPQSGDVAVFTWRQRTGGAGGRSAAAAPLRRRAVRHHSELVAEWEDDEEVEDFVTVGANTSAPIYVKVKGEGVHKKLRQKEEAVVSNHISGSLEVKPRPLINPFVKL